jgi:cytochrome c-type biogenesis protein
MFESLLSNLNAENFQLMIRENFHWAAFIAFLGGLIDCLTPCSAMANTISVGYTSTIAPGVTRKRMWLLAFLFFMGVSLTYMGLGALFVAFGSVVQTFIGEYVEVVLFVMGFIFLYLFLLNINVLPLWAIPKFLRGTEVKDLGGKQGSPLGAFLVGVAVALTMGPCAAPILILILGVIATLPVNEIHLGIGLMFFFSVAIGLFTATLSFVVARQGMKALGKLSGARRVVGYVMDGVMGLAAVALLSAAVLISIYGAGILVPPTQVGADCEQPEPASLLYTFDQLADDAEEIQAISSKVVGETMPEFSWTDAEDKGHALSQYRGKYVFLAFWFRNCANCVAKIGKINETVCSYQDDDRLVFLSINSGDDPKDMRWVVEHYNMIYPAISDEFADLIQFLGNPSMPLYLLIDPQGKVAYFGGELPPFGDFVPLGEEG